MILEPKFRDDPLNANKLVFAQININSLSNTFELLVDQVLMNLKQKLMIVFPLGIF